MADAVDTSADTTGQAAESGPSEADIKATFAQSVEADEPADGEAKKPKDAKPEKLKSKDAPKKDEDDEESKPPTHSERAAFRAERRALRQQREEFEAHQAEQTRLFQLERQVWHRAHEARKAGDVIGVLRALDIDPEAFSQQLAAHAAGDDPRLSAMQRRLAEYERQRYQEQEAAQAAQAEANLKRQQAQLESVIGDTLGGSDDATLRAIGEDPELVAMVRADLTEAWRDDGGDEASARKYLTPQAYLAAARRVARQLKAEHTRRGRLFRESVADEPGTDPKPSAAAKLDSRGGKQKQPTRTLPASQGGSRVRTSDPDPNTTAGMSAIKRRFAEMIQSADD